MKICHARRCWKLLRRCLGDMAEVRAAARLVETDITHQPKIKFSRKKARTDDFSIFISVDTFIK